MYRKRSHRVGSSKPADIENRDGVPTIVEHGFTVAIKLCALCVGKAEQAGHYPPVPYNLKGLA